MRLIIDIKAHPGDVQGIKEAVCMALEKWGSGCVVEVVLNEKRS